MLREGRLRAEHRAQVGRRERGPCRSTYRRIEIADQRIAERIAELSNRSWPNGAGLNGWFSRATDPAVD